MRKRGQRECFEIASRSGVWCPELRFPAIRKPKSHENFSKNKSHIKNSLRSDRFDMELNEKFQPLSLSKWPPKSPGRSAWEGWHRGRNPRRRCSGEENLSFCILQTPEHSVKCGNSNLLDNPPALGHNRICIDYETTILIGG